MKLLKSVFAFYINSSIHVALAVVAFMTVTVMKNQLIVPAALWFFVFFGSITAYNFVKFANIAGLHHRRLAKSLRTIQIFSLVCFLGFCYSVLLIPISALLVTASFGLLTLFYAIPFFENKSLRTFSGIKIFVVALVWAGVTVIVPFIAAGQDISTIAFLAFTQRFLLVVALILPFEIRDVPYDDFSLNTLPQKFGERNVKILGIVLLLSCLIIEVFKKETSAAYLISLVILCVLIGFVIIISRTNQTQYFASFWVEAIPIVWFVVLWVLYGFQFSSLGIY